jgi:hypothetical protein
MDLLIKKKGFHPQNGKDTAQYQKVAKVSH